MTLPLQGLPDDVIEALQQGQTIEAIKRLRQASGLGLKEAKDAVDAYQRGEPVQLPPVPEAFSQSLDADALPSTVVAALRAGNKIEAIRLLREARDIGLKEAKDIVDAAPIALPSSAAAGHGERNVIWWLLLLVGAALAAYYLI